LRSPAALERRIRRRLERRRERRPIAGFKAPELPQPVQGSMQSVYSQLETRSSTQDCGTAPPAVPRRATRARQVTGIQEIYFPHFHGIK